MSSLSVVGEGVLYFVTLIVFATAAGFGLLSLVGFPDDRRNRYFLAPLAITMAWALTGGLLVRFGLTMGQVAPPMWAASMLLAAVGAWTMLRDRSSTPDRTVVVLLCGSAAATAVCMSKMLGRGLMAELGTPNLDTFFYTTLAAGYWEHGLASQGVTLFFDQLGGYMVMGTYRNHTFVLLSFFSNLVEAGEPLFVRNLFVCWTLFTIGTSATYFFRVARFASIGGAPLTLLYVWTVMGIGWAFVPSGVGNWDNALFVAVTPALAGLAFERPGWPSVSALGVTVAYAFLTYPELAPIGGAVVAPFFIYRMFAGFQRPGSVFTQYAVASAIALAVAAPALSSLSTYFVGQMRAAVSELRPGGAFVDGLLNSWWNPAAWWAFGPEFSAPAGTWATAAALVLTLIALVGAVRAAKSPRAPVIWSILIVAGLLAYVLVVERYSYAGYKILSVAWWLVALLLVHGLVAFWSVVVRAPWSWVARPAAALLIVGALGVASAKATINRSAYFFPAWADQLVPTPNELMDLRELARRQPPGDVVIQGELLNAPSLPWVLYALRSTPLRVYVGAKPEHPFASGFVRNEATEPDGVLVTSNEGHSGAPVLIDVPRFTLLDYVRSGAATR